MSYSLVTFESGFMLIINYVGLARYGTLKNLAKVDIVEFGAKFQWPQVNVAAQLNWVLLLPINATWWLGF